MPNDTLVTPPWWVLTLPRPRHARLAMSTQATLRLGEVITTDEPLISVDDNYRLEISGSERNENLKFSLPYLLFIGACVRSVIVARCLALLRVSSNVCVYNLVPGMHVRVCACT